MIERFRRAGVIALVSLLSWAGLVAGAGPAVAAQQISTGPGVPGAMPRLDFSKTIRGGHTGHRRLPTGRTVGRAATLTGTTYYYYAGGYQTGLSAEGIVSTNPYIYKPTLSANGWHSLYEMAAQAGASYGDTIEVGWTVDPITCTAHDSNPCLFVGSWVGGVFQGYGTNFIPSSSATIHHGDSLAAYIGTYKQLNIQYINGYWWIAWNGVWQGAFNGSNWSGTFTRLTKAQLFGEVATDCATPCGDQMGSGVLANTTSVGAYAANYGISNNIPSTTAASLTQLSRPYPTNYTSSFLASMRSFRYGGPG